MHEAVIKESIIDEKNGILIYRGNYFEIGSAFLEILNILKSNESKIKTLECLKFKYNIADDECIALLADVEDLLHKIEGDTQKKPSRYIKNGIIILNSTLVRFIASIFQFLYNKFAFSFSLLLIIISHVFFFIHKGEIVQNVLIEISSVDILLYYLLAICALLFHEVGHAAASSSWGVKPHEIGFGFYFIFPVFYSNVNDIWKIDRWKRISVNFGGIYFQTISNSILICILFLSGLNTDSLTVRILYKVINVNFAVILFSLTPFFRNDGYWIYSDFFKLPNLLLKSDSLIVNIFSLNYLKRLKLNQTYLQVFALYIFTLGNWLFRLGIIFFMLKLLPNTILDVVKLFDEGAWKFFEVFRLVVKLSLITMGLYFQGKNIVLILFFKSSANDGI